MNRNIEMKNTHIVIKKEDALKYLSEPALQSLEEILNMIEQGRIRDGKKGVNEYYICNTDEPYAEFIHNMILIKEHGKNQVIKEEKH